MPSCIFSWAPDGDYRQPCWVIVWQQSSNCPPVFPLEPLVDTKDRHAGLKVDNYLPYALLHYHLSPWWSLQRALLGYRLATTFYLPSCIVTWSHDGDYRQPCWVIGWKLSSNCPPVLALEPQVETKGCHNGLKVENYLSNALLHCHLSPWWILQASMLGYELTTTFYLHSCTVTWAPGEDYRQPSWVIGWQLSPNFPPAKSLELLVETTDNHAVTYCAGMTCCCHY